MGALVEHAPKTSANMATEKRLKHLFFIFIYLINTLLNALFSFKNKKGMQPPFL
jgi:hypothetical protein